MKLVIGGYAQGKLDVVLAEYGKERCVVWNANEEKEAVVEGKILVINDLHLWILKWMKEGVSPKERLKELLEDHPDCICIGDEVGNGIVPMDPFERAYRETTGRIYIALAREAKEVEKVTCGISQRLK